MASVEVTAEWTDPTGALVDAQTYVVQNKSSGVVQFFEGASFNAVANDGDGVLLLPLYHAGSGRSDLVWTYSAANEIRMRVSGAIPNTPNLVEFFPTA